MNKETQKLTGGPKGPTNRGPVACTSDVLIQSAHEMGQWLKQLPKPILITGKSGAGKSVSMLVAKLVGLVAFDLDWAGRHSRFGPIPNTFGDEKQLPPMRGVAFNDQWSIVLRLEDGYFELLGTGTKNFKVTDFRASVNEMQNSLKGRSLKSEEVLSILRGVKDTSLICRLALGPELSDMWLIEPRLLGQADIYVGTGENIERVIEKIKPATVIYSRLEDTLQRQVWRMKANEYSLKHGETSTYVRKWREQAAFSDAKLAEAAAAKAVVVSRLAAVNNSAYLSFVLKDFGLGQKNAWAGPHEEAKLKHLLSAKK